jgi:hypothetical protein
MLPESGNKAVLSALAVLLVVAALGYWGYGGYRKLELRDAVVALVKDASRRFDGALAMETGPASADNAQAVQKLDEHAQEVDRHVTELHGLALWRDRVLAETAEDYLLTVREILRKQAASHRYGIQVQVDKAALRELMRGANRRSRAWMDEAVREKDRLEKDYFDYRLSADAFGRLLDAYPESRRKLAAEIPAAPLTAEDAVQAVRERAAQRSRRAENEMQQIRQLAAVR